MITLFAAAADITAPVTSSLPAGGSYNSAQVVTLTASEPATIYYTLDGSTPSVASPVYSGPLTISVTTTLKYFALDASGNAETVKQQVYTIDTVAPVVTAYPPGGSYATAPLQVTLTPSESATIYYTLDVSDPSVASPVYSGPISISTDTVIKFMAKDLAGNYGSITAESYLIDTVAPVITADPVGSLFIESATVTLTANEPATIYYTLDGSTPSVASLVYAAPLVITATTVIKAIAVDAAGNTSAVMAETYTATIPAIDTPPTGWQASDPVDAPGPSGSWSDLPAPVPPVAGQQGPIYAVTSCPITLNGLDITKRVDRCVVTNSESAVFGTCELTLPVGLAVSRGDTVVVDLSGVQYVYLVEDPSAEGPARSIWCRSAACVLDEPHAAEINLNGWDTPYAAAAALAAAVCGTVALDWQLPDWNLPNRWELTGTPIECLQTLVASVGGILQSTPDGGITARRRWPVRPPDLAGATPLATIRRATALDDSPLTVKPTSGKGYGSVTVYGYDTAALLPDMELEESSPVLGSPVHVRLFWPTQTPLPFDSFVTDGSAVKLSSADLVVSAEELIFENGAATTRYPIKHLHSCEWIGANGGALWWLENGNSKELSTITPGVRGIAKVTYTTSYERWQLTGQTAEKCLFGIDVGQGQVSAVVSYVSGGSVAPAQTAPLINDLPGCIEAGTAYLDTNRAFVAVSALLPLTTEPIVPGCTVLADDTVSGVYGNGKVVSATITLEPGQTTRAVEVQVPC